jgi:hypothetical protein
MDMLNRVRTRNSKLAVGALLLGIAAIVVAIVVGTLPTAARVGVGVVGGALALWGGASWFANRQNSGGLGGNSSSGGAVIGDFSFHLDRIDDLHNSLWGVYGVANININENRTETVRFTPIPPESTLEIKTTDGGFLYTEQHYHTGGVEHTVWHKHPTLNGWAYLGIFQTQP